MVKIIKPITFTLFVVMAFFAINGQASSETIQYPLRGEGTGEISGYTITNLHFRLAEDPSIISAVEFDLNGPASEVLINFDPPSNLTFSCSNPAGYDWVCELDAVKTGEVTEIYISATG